MIEAYLGAGAAARLAAREARMAEPLLSVKGLFAGYGDVDVLRGIDLDVADGEIVAVLGIERRRQDHVEQDVVRRRARRASGEIVFDGQRIDRLAPPEIVAAGLIHVPEGRRSSRT